MFTVVAMQSHLDNVPRAVLATFAQVFGIVKGCVGGICLYGALPLFYFRGIGAADYQRYRAIAFLPWGGKALVAATSDTRPIGGWYKRYYLVAGGVVLILALIGVGVSTSAENALGFLTVCSVAIVVIDALFGTSRRLGGPCNLFLNSSGGTHVRLRPLQRVCTPISLLSSTRMSGSCRTYGDLPWPAPCSPP